MKFIHVLKLCYTLWEEHNNVWRQLSGFFLNSSIFRQKWTKTELNYELTKFVQQLIYIYIHKTVTYVSALVSDW